MIKHIEELIKSKLNILEIKIADFTANHQNHKTYDSGGHYQAIIISEDFEGLSLLERHKKIYDILGDLMKKEIHAFSMKTYTPQESNTLNEK